MNRREKLAGGIDLSSASIAEIGALCNPLLTKAEADIVYVDYADAASLRKHYEGNPSVDPSRIVDTDAIWGAQTLREALGKRVDFVIASHVIEHVPDLITWLNELHSSLNKDGQVRLAIPDKRFTFDLLRRETEQSEVLAAYLMRQRVPGAYAILDYLLNATAVDANAVWRGEVNEKTLVRPDTYQSAMSKAREALQEGRYHDAHCWVFTPKSFAILLGQLVSKQLVKFACHSFQDTEQNDMEFFVTLRASDNLDEVTNSWRGMAEAARVAFSGAEFRTDVSLIGLGQEKERAGLAEERLVQAVTGARTDEGSLETVSERSRSLAAQLANALTSLDHARSEIEQLRQSHSWRLTGPLRSLATLLGRASDRRSAPWR